MKELTEEQKWLYKQIMNLGKTKIVIDMSDEELFAVLDRIKFCYYTNNLINDKNAREVIKEHLNN